MSTERPDVTSLRSIQNQLRTVISLLEEMTDGPDTARLLTREEAADVLNVSVRTLDALEEAGKIRAIRIGRSVRYHPETVDRFVRRRAEEK